MSGENFTKNWEEFENYLLKFVLCNGEVIRYPMFFRLANGIQVCFRKKEVTVWKYRNKDFTIYPFNDQDEGQWLVCVYTRCW